MNPLSEIAKEISCRITRTLLLYVREQNNGTLGNLLDGLPLVESYLSDTNNWVSHAFLHSLYARMIEMLGDDNAVYQMTDDPGIKALTIHGDPGSHCEAAWQVEADLLNPPRGKPRGIFTGRIKKRFSVRSLTPPQAARNALAIAVQDLLTLARRNVATKKTIAINHVVNDLMTSPEYERIIALRPNLIVERNLSRDILDVVGSETHISKTLINLIANAADAMPAGGRIAITTRDCYIDSPYTGFEIVPEGEYVVLEISGEGIGMPHTDLEKIFEPFYTKKAMGRSGTGLGMSVVWGTVKDHEGYINITTEEGTGTTFVVYLPASRSKKETATSVYIEDYLGKGESVLVIDDSPEQRELAKRMMLRLGYDVHTAASGEAAVALIKEQSHDVLILDMIMPSGMDGLETYRSILNLAPDQKAVIASGYAETERVREAQRLGAGSYIKKPYTLEKIGLTVRSELDRED